MLCSYLVGQLVLLHKRTGVQGGELRIGGLSESNRQVLHVARLGEQFPVYPNRETALRGYSPT